VNIKRYGNLILRLSKQIWHQTFCPAEAGDEADMFTVTRKQNTQDSQITASVEEHTINGWPSHAFPSRNELREESVYLPRSLNVYLDIEGHILTCGQWQTYMGQGEEKLVSWTTAEIIAVTPVRGRDAFSPCYLNGFRSKKNPWKHTKPSLASCSNPKPTQLQAGKAIPGSPHSREDQQDAHRRAPMFHSRTGAPREMQFGLSGCSTGWQGHPCALVTTVLCHTPTPVSKLHLDCGLWEP